MAPKVTSARDRSKGKARKPVTTSKGRANRQGAASGKPITQRGRQERGGARVTSSASRPAAPGTPAALPPGKKGGPLAKRTPGGQPRLPGGTGNQPRLPGGTGGAPRGMRGGDSVTSGGARTGRGTPVRAALPPSTRIPAPGPTGVVKALGRGGGGGLLGPIGTAFLLGGQIGKMMEPSRGQQAINRRVSDDAAREAEERANPTRGGLTGDQRLANAKAGRKRRELKQAAATAAAQKKSSPPSSTRQVPASGGGGGGGARVPSSGGGGGGSPSRPATVPPKPAPGQSPNMDENYATWTRANKKLAEKVKPGQAGYAVIQKTLAQMKGGA